MILSQKRKLKYYLTLSHFQRSHLPTRVDFTWAEREDCRVAPKAPLNCEHKHAKHRLSLKRNWNEEETTVARTTLEEVTTWNVMPLGSQWPNRHQNTTDRRETQAKLNHSPPTEWAAWHEVELHLLGIKFDTQKHKNQSGNNSWSDIKFNSVWDKEKDFLEIKLLKTTTILQRL